MYVFLNKFRMICIILCSFCIFFFIKKIFLIIFYKSKILFDKLIYINVILERGDIIFWLFFDELVI